MINLVDSFALVAWQNRLARGVRQPVLVVRAEEKNKRMARGERLGASVKFKKRELAVSEVASPVWNRGHFPAFHFRPVTSSNALMSGLGGDGSCGGAEEGPFGCVGYPVPGATSFGDADDVFALLG